MENLNRETSQKILDLKSSLPLIILEKQFLLQPRLKEQYSERHKKLYLEDTAFHFSYLAESIAADEPILFNEYLSWAKIFFSTLPIDLNDIILNLEILRDTLASNMNSEMAALTNRYVNEGIDKFKSQSAELASFILESNPLNTIASDYLNFLIDGNKKDALDLILEIVNKGISIKDIYLNIFQATQKETGRLWQMGKITVAQEHFITAATQLIMSQLYPYLFSSTKKEKKIIITCASGELHEIGARMVADLFEMDGWNSYFFGANTPQNSFISAIEVYKPEVIAISTTMTFNLSTVSDLINSVRKNPKTNYVKILVGGYPFNLADNLWQSVGADGHAMDALSAINLANEFLN